MTDEEKIRYIRYMELKEELDIVSFNGVKLKLDGQKANAHAIASVCVFQEESDYMRDYVRNNEGRLAELNFDVLE